MSRLKPSPQALHTPKGEIPLELRRKRGTRRLTLRYEPISEIAVLTLPYGVSTSEGLAFARSRVSWLTKVMAEHPPRIPLAAGVTLPVLGREYTVHHTPGRGLIALEDNILRVYGEEAFIARRLRDYLIARLRGEIEARAELCARALEVKIRRIQLRDTTSRWGSCTTGGRLSFSWRLIFAPAFVLDYMVCHEVAHLREMSHNARFWRIVAEICPHHQKGRDWLNDHGHTLYRYG